MPETIYNDNQIDEVGIVRSPQEQSGNYDVGHIQQREQQLRADQGGHLADLQVNYFSGQMSYQDVVSSLQDEGYSDNQVQTLANSFHAENVYRNTHDGIPSNLAPNQIQYLYDQFGDNINQVHIIPSPIAGSPSTRFQASIREEGASGQVELPLPVPIPIEVLTQQQQTEIEQLEQIKVILDQHFANPRVEIQPRPLNDFDKRQIDEALGHYYRGETDILGLTTDLSSLVDVDTLNNPQLLITDIIRDATLERDYRNNNDGRPSNISPNLYRYIQNNPLMTAYDQRRGYAGTTRYTGEQIYVVPGTNTFYILTPMGRAILPVLDEEGNPTPDQDILPTTIERQLPQQLRAVGGQVADIGTDTQNGLRPRGNQGLTIQQQNDLADDTALLINGDLNFQAYLAILDANYNLSQYQYTALVQYVSQNPHLESTNEELEQVNFYSDKPLFVVPIVETGQRSIMTENQYITYLASRGSNQEEVNNIINPTKIRFDRAHEVLVYQRFGGQLVNPNRQGGVGNLLGDLNAGSVRPQDVIDAYNNAPPVAVRTDPITGNPIIPQQQELEPPQPTITPSTTYDEGPQATGLGIPHDTSRFQPSLEENIEIRGYQNYYENNQSLYVGFRETFKDILPSVTGMIGAGVSFSFFRARDRGYLGQVLRQNRILLDILLARLEQQATQLANVITTREQQRERLEQAREVRRGTIQAFGDQAIPIQQRQDPMGVGQLRNILPQELLGQIDEQNVEQLDDVFQDEIDRINNLEAEINLIENDIDTLENNIVDAQVERVRINEDFAEILNRDYSLLDEIQQNLPQILSGLQIGVALGQVLSGYIFPTYFEDETISEEARAVTRIEKKPNEAEHKRAKTKISTQELSENKKEPLLETGPINKPFRQDEYYNENIIAGQMKYSRSKGRPLNGREIRELKSILNKEELARFEGKNLFYNPKGKIDTKDGSKCISYLKKPILGVDVNKSRFF